MVSFDELVKREEEKERLGKQKAKEGYILRSREAVQNDFNSGTRMGAQIIGEGLGRLAGNSDVVAAKTQMSQRAKEGLSDREETAVREKALTQIGGAEQAQRRGLAASLARSGVKGGAAGQMQVELAAQALQNRRNFETELVMNDEATKRKAELDFTNFTTKIAEFDLGQAAKEKNILAQAGLAAAQIGSADRAAYQASIAQENAAKASSGSCFIAGTQVSIDSNNTINIEDLNIGDSVSVGGRVTAIMKFKNDAPLVEIGGNIMTESHPVFDEGRGEWVKAKDHSQVKASTKRADFVYCVNTEKHTLLLGTLIVTDFALTDVDINDSRAIRALNSGNSQSSFARYMKEEYNRDTLETSEGFLVYKIRDKECHIFDLYIDSTNRGFSTLLKFFSWIKEEAQRKGCAMITSLISTGVGRTEKASKLIRAYSRYGFNIVAAQNDQIILRKDL